MSEDDCCRSNADVKNVWRFNSTPPNALMAFTKGNVAFMSTVLAKYLKKTYICIVLCCKFTDKITYCYSIDITNY